MVSLIKNILEVELPSELFDCDNPKERFRELVLQYHPDKGGSEKEFIHLKNLWERYKTGQAEDVGDFWSIGDLKVGSVAFAKGDKANYYKLYDPSKPRRNLALRIPRNGIDSSNAQKIIKVTQSVARSSNVDFSAFMPLCYEPLKVNFGSKKRESLILQRMVGWATLQDVVDQVGKIHILDSAWIIRRLLAVLGAFYEADKTHNNISLEHVMIEPDMHGLALCGLSETRFKPDAKTDAAAAKTVITQLTDMSTVPRQMQAFIKNLDLEPVPHFWELRTDFDTMLMKATKDRLRFREFDYEVTTID